MHHVPGGPVRRGHAGAAPARSLGYKRQVECRISETLSLERRDTRISLYLSLSFLFSLPAFILLASFSQRRNGGRARPREVEERPRREGSESSEKEEESWSVEVGRRGGGWRSRRRSRKAHRARTQEEVPVTNCGLIVREIAPAACCALLLLLLMLPSVLHVVSSTLRQPPGVLKILIPLKIDRVSGYATPGDRIIVLQGWIYVGDFWPVRNCNWWWWRRNYLPLSRGQNSRFWLGERLRVTTGVAVEKLACSECL